MRSALALVLILTAALVAGCIGDDGSQDGTDDALGCPAAMLDRTGLQIVEPTHDPLAGLAPENAFDFTTTNVRTCSLPAIGWSPLSPDGTPHRYIGEIDMRGDLDLGAVAVLGNGEPAKVYLVDISDRAAPHVVSVIDQENTYIVDVKISEDGAYLYTASQSVPTSPEFEGLTELEGPTGFTVYDISDPATPVYLRTVPDAQIGCHMLAHKSYSGTDSIFCISQQLRMYGMERTAAGPVSFGFIDYFPEESGTPRPSAPPLVGGLVPDPGSIFSSGPHDVTVVLDEKDQRRYAIVSHWGSGVRVVDVTDLPDGIQEVGAWQGADAKHYHGNVHTAMMFYVGEQRYIAASPEYTFDGAVPSLWVLDATDLADLRLVAEWYHPGEHESQGLFMTTHQWQVAPTGTDVNLSEVRIYLTMNHGGIWVLDFGAILEGDNQAAILGFNLARQEIDPEVQAALANAMLATWDVNVVDGYIYGSDRATGLWVFHYAGDALGDGRRTGFA